jgi:hypothetical protein
MNNYYLNKNAQSNGDHEIHKESCYYYYMYRGGFNFEFFGAFATEFEAIRYARSKYPYLKIDGCAYCCPSIHQK